MAAELFELVLCVKDAEASARFYREVVGLEPINPLSDGWGSFWVGPKEENRWLGIRQGPLLFEEHSPLPEGARFGPVHFALKVNESDIEAALARLKQHQIEILGPKEWPSGRFLGRSYYFYDPDHNLVEFWVPSGRND